MKNRIYSLDYLRGLAAFGIMIYHYLSWTYGQFLSNTILGRIGLYGVSIFYVLSGLTLYYVYFHKMIPNKLDVFNFFKKRFFRIYPLLWLTTFLSIILSKSTPDLYDLFLNLTGLFGFIKWWKYYSPGVWSIGNELVFYTLFPVFVFITKKMKFGIYILFITFLSIYIYFAFFILNSSYNIDVQWTNYINPLNQIFLFLSGFIVGYFFEYIHIRNQILILIFTISLTYFAFYPVYGNTIF